MLSFIVLILFLGIQFDVSHYNVLLSVYLQNHHTFSPLEILEEMKKNNVEPNQVCLTGKLSFPVSSERS